MRGQKGFTLIELLVVIIIIAILAAIAIPTFLGQRQKAQDSAAKSIVRNAMTAMESAYVDTRDFQTIDAVMLQGIEPSITFLDVADCATLPTAEADEDTVNFHAIDADVYEVGAVSLSDKTFGVIVNKTADDTTYAPGNTFYIDGDEEAW
jgi:prepilin-type N-terminal cleavage/methylation domain-containing protein